jgi:predicted transcriptional regulator
VPQTRAGAGDLCRVDAPLVAGVVCHRRAQNKPVSGWYHARMALTLRTDDQLERALAALAESEGLSRQEIIRRAVLERYERSSHRARVEDSTERMIDRWGDVLDRLGSV